MFFKLMGAQEHGVGAHQICSRTSSNLSHKYKFAEFLLQRNEPKNVLQVVEKKHSMEIYKPNYNSHLMNLRQTYI